MELTSALVPISAQTDVAEARRRAAELTTRLGFDETAAGHAAIAVTEAATNLLKHAGGGELFVGVNEGTTSGLQIIAMDRGGGIRDIPGSLRDGVSTAGTAGNGLGAIKRLASSFDVYSMAGRGTVLSATLYSATTTAPLASGMSVPAPRETVCGDAWAVWSAGQLMSVFVADGLGHGLGAATAAAIAVSTFLREAERSAEHVIQSVHDALKSTRGAAVAVAEMDRRNDTLRYCGLGNIAARVARADGKEQQLVSLSGIAGHVARRLQTFTVPWLPGMTLVMHSDGVGTRWSLDEYPALSRRLPGVIAGVLIRDHRRANDDATVVVAQYSETR